MCKTIAAADVQVHTWLEFTSGGKTSKPAETLSGTLDPYVAIDRDNDQAENRLKPYEAMVDPINPGREPSSLWD